MSPYGMVWYGLDVSVSLTYHTTNWIPALDAYTKIYFQISINWLNEDFIARVGTEDVALRSSMFSSE